MTNKTITKKQSSSAFVFLKDKGIWQRRTAKPQDSERPLPSPANLKKHK